MKWLILAIFAEVSVLLCLIFAFDGALHSLSSARLTWDHFAVLGAAMPAPACTSRGGDWRVRPSRYAQAHCVRPLKLGSWGLLGFLGFLGFLKFQ